MAIYRLGAHVPRIAADCFIAPEATIIGDVTIGSGSNIWPGAVLRGDVEPITIGNGCSIQDNAVLHTDPGCPLSIGDGVTVGHQATLHGCRIGNGSLIGMQAIVLNLAVIGQSTLVGAGAIITERKQFGDRVLIVGAPAKVVRELTAEQIEQMRELAQRYVDRGADYVRSLQPVSRTEAGQE